MSRWRIEQSRPEHIPDIAANMREADKREVWAFARQTPEEALRISLSRSIVAWTGIIDERPELMWGATSPTLLSSTGTPWMLGTDAYREFTRDFLRCSRFFVRRMLTLFTRLENYVHAENADAIRWLRWCGFGFDWEPVQFNGENFHRFWRFAHA
jgi:hypothetical protein